MTALASIAIASSSEVLPEADIAHDASRFGNHGRYRHVVFPSDAFDQPQMADPSNPGELAIEPNGRTAFHPQINSALSLVAGKLNDQTIRVWQSHRIYEYLLAADQRRQVWHCWLSHQREINGPEQAYRYLTRSKSTDILTDVFGCCPSGLISALSKLGAQARRKEFYAALVGVLKRGGPLARHVHHLKQISDETIFALAAINDHPTSDRLLKVLLKRAKLHQFAELAWIISRLALVLGESEVGQSILVSGNPTRAIDKLIGQLPFPEPPFHSDSDLNPITTGDALRKIGKKFRNCLVDHSTWFDAVIEVQAGRTYFYRWDGSQPAILSFSRFGSLGWIPGQFEAANGDVPHGTTRREVEQVLRGIPEVGPTSMKYGCRS